MAKPIRLGNGRVRVETALGVVTVHPGWDEDGRVVETVDVTPHPTDPRDAGLVLLANVQDQRHSVRLIRLKAAADVPRVVEEERLDLVRRVLAALSVETGLPWVPAVRSPEEVAAAVAARVDW
jgi:hypothetical protein